MPGALIGITLEGEARQLSDAGEPSSRLDELVLAGATTRPTAHVVSGGILCIMIGLRPGALHALTGAAADEFTNRHVALGDLWGKARRVLPEQLAEAGAAARMAVLETWLRRMLARHLRRRPVFSPAQVDWLRERAGREAPRELAGALGISVRHFERRFRVQFGMPAKLYQRLGRFYRLAELMRQDPHPQGFAGLAAELGYYDQSHLSKECKAFTGFSPSALIEGVLQGDPELRPYANYEVRPRMLS
ncbi:MAG: helix-turn-helix domain-containing protein [Ectothiorhodospiraceae bacterium]|nr:helix-turn-helix domain-containing protein [Ectothiorhodospiraceae bacterium]